MMNKLLSVLFLSIFLVVSFVFAKPLITPQPQPDVNAKVVEATPSEIPVNPPQKQSKHSVKSVSSVKTVHKTVAPNLNPQSTSATSLPAAQQSSMLVYVILSIAGILALYGFFDSILNDTQKERLRKTLQRIAKKNK